MADQATLAAQRRMVTGKAVKRLRKQGLIPGNVSSHSGQPIPIQVDRHTFERFIKTHPRTALISLTIPGAPAQTTMVGRVQREPVSGAIQHVDFVQVQMNQRIHTRVPIHIIGESPAVRGGDGILLHLHNDIEVEALPGDLPSALEIDVSGLEKVDDAAHVRDLKVPAGVKLLHANPEDVVVKVAITRAAIEEAAEEAAAPAPEGAPAEESGRSEETTAAE